MKQKTPRINATQLKKLFPCAGGLKSFRRRFGRRGASAADLIKAYGKTKPHWLSWLVIRGCYSPHNLKSEIRRVSGHSWAGFVSVVSDRDREFWTGEHGEKYLTLAIVAATPK